MLAVCAVAAFFRPRGGSFPMVGSGVAIPHIGEFPLSALRVVAD